MFDGPFEMTTRTLVKASKPKFAAADKLSIEVIAEFAELKSLGPIPFIAAKNDETPHGRAIFERALKGDFGRVAAFKKPPASKK